MPVESPRKPPVRFTSAPSYFEHNERKHNPQVKRYDIIEWDEPPPAPPIEVSETRNQRLVERFRRKLQKLHKD
jgi:hypothetical protein